MHEFHPNPKLTLYAAVSTGVNTSGVITGWFWTGTATNPPGIFMMGFLRDRTGNYTTFSAFDSLRTHAEAINSAGVIAGDYQDSANVYHGFVRDAEGNVVSFDAPSPGYQPATLPTSINSSGAIVGYTNSNTEEHAGIYPGFLRETNGHIIALHPPESTQVFPAAITDDGVIVGSFNTDSAHKSGFIRDPQGHYTTFNVPVAEAIQTISTAINPNGTIVAYYLTTTNPHAQLLKAFYRNPDGTFGFFAPPGAATTVPTAIAADGTIIGYERDSTGYTRDFIRPNSNPPATLTMQNKNTSVESAH